MFKVISDILPHWYDLLLLQLISAMHDLCIDVYQKQS